MTMKYIPYRPSLQGLFATRFYEKAQQLADLKSLSDINQLVSQEVIWSINDCSINPKQRGIYRVAFLLLRDLINAGWSYRWLTGNLELATPTNENLNSGKSSSEVKAFWRNAMVESRLQKIAESKEFILKMENPNGGIAKKPINTLIADGKSLYDNLSEIGSFPDEMKLQHLRNKIQPYLQLVNSNERCKETGYRLIDIWRYFRFTWATPAENIPGRTMQYLIRDAARPFHPIIGIASLGNVPMAIKCRDSELGWNFESFKKKIESLEQTNLVVAELHMLLRNIDHSIEDIKTDGLCSKDECDKPNDIILQRLQLISAKSADERKDALREWWSQDEEELSIERSEYGNVSKSAFDALFKRKRADQLYKLLNSKKIISELLGRDDFKSHWSKFINSEVGQKAIGSALMAIKNRHVGTSMLELNVCGAIPPYNEILGGKLVALLMLSPQVILDYKQRYGASASEIASNIKGEPVIRPAELVYMETTSLYSVGSSQYNRLKLPKDLINPNSSEVHWKRIGVTQGFGTLHISGATAQCLDDIARDDFQNVNHIFGEGPSPKLRVIREGLEVLFGQEGHEVVVAFSKHSMNRLVYGAWLTSNGARYFKGDDDKPVYYYDMSVSGEEATQKIVDYWMQRWLLSRLQYKEAINRLKTFDPEVLRVSKQILEYDLDIPDIHSSGGDNEMANIQPKIGDNTLDYVRKLYRGTGAYADKMPKDMLDLIHIPTSLDEAVFKAASENKHVVLTGNPGDGKTHLLRMLEPRLNELTVKPVIELDASRLTNEQLFIRWKLADSELRPFCVAINQAVLFDLADSYPEFQPLQETRQQVIKAISYEDKIYDEYNYGVIVFDLSLRNILSAEVIKQVIYKLTGDNVLSNCKICNTNSCDFFRHAKLLKSTMISERMQGLFDRVSRRGYHATLREVQAFISYLLFAGRTCEQLIQTSGDLKYQLPQLVYSGKGNLFDIIASSFDPIKTSHPIWDDRLIYAETRKEDWSEDWFNEMDSISTTNLSRFQARKRAFYFMHNNGEDLLKLAGQVENEFADLFSSNERNALRKLVRRINRFFGDNSGNDSLRVWQNHRYNQSPRRTIYSVNSYDRQDFERLVPQLSFPMKEGFELALDHVLVRLKSNNKVSLKVDFDLFYLLWQAEQGVPVFFIENDISRRLWLFMEHLFTPMNTDEVKIILLDTASGKEINLTVDVEYKQYLAVDDRE